MIEICEGMIVFGRYDETEFIPKPRFGGSKGEEFEKWADRVTAMFMESLVQIESVSLKISLLFYTKTTGTVFMKLFFAFCYTLISQKVLKFFLY